jgi:ankyrin repeat protein
MVRLFIKIPGLDLGVVGDQNPLLVWAATMGDVELLQVLLGHPELDVNAVDRNDQIVFLVAVRSRNQGMIDLIKQCPRLDLWAVDAKGRSQLELAAAAGSLTAVREILSVRGAHQSEHIREINTAMRKLFRHERVSQSQHAPDAKNLADVIEMFLGIPRADVNLPVFPVSLLIFAATHHLVDLMKRLLSFEDLNVNAVHSGTTALISAISSGDQQIAEILIASKRADLNIITGAGETALSAAVLHSLDQVAIVRRILEFPQFDPSCHRSSELFREALRRGRDEIASLLLTIPTVNVNAVAEIFVDRCNKNIDLFRQIINHPTFDRSLESTAAAFWGVCRCANTLFLSGLLPLIKT